MQTHRHTCIKHTKFSPHSSFPQEPLHDCFACACICVHLHSRNTRSYTCAYTDIPVVVCPVTQSPLLYIIIVVIQHHRCSCLNVCNACYQYTHTCTCTCSRYNSVCKVTCSGGVVCIEILDEVWLSSFPQLHKGSNLICECIYPCLVPLKGCSEYGRARPGGCYLSPISNAVSNF